MNKDISQLAQSRTTKTLLRQLSVIYSLGTWKVTYLIAHYIILFKNLIYIYKLLPIIYSDLLFITPILYLILNIPALLSYQALLVSLLRVISGVNSYSIILNLTQSLKISTKVRESLGNIVVKDIKNTPLLRPRLLKSLIFAIKTYLRIGKLTLI